MDSPFFKKMEKEILEYRKASAEWMKFHTVQMRIDVGKRVESYYYLGKEEICIVRKWNPDTDFGQMGMIWNKLRKDFMIKMDSDKRSIYLSIISNNYHQSFIGHSNLSEMEATRLVFMEYIKSEQ